MAHPHARQQVDVAPEMAAAVAVALPQHARELDARRARPEAQDEGAAEGGEGVPDDELVCGEAVDGLHRALADAAEGGERAQIGVVEDVREQLEREALETAEGERRVWVWPVLSVVKRTERLEEAGIAGTVAAADVVDLAREICRWGGGAHVRGDRFGLASCTEDCLTS